MEPAGEGTGVEEVSRTEAGMRVLLMQLAEAAAQERNAERGRELLATVVRALRAILVALRQEECSDQGAEVLLKSRRAPFLRLDSSAQEVADLLALRIASPLRHHPPLPLRVCNEAVELTGDYRRFLEYVGYEDTADGLVLSDPDAAADNIESTYAGKEHTTTTR